MNIIKGKGMFKTKGYIYSIIAIVFLVACSPKTTQVQTTTPSNQPGFLWEASTIYFLMTDRFYNADPSNDHKHELPPAPLRGYAGGDVAGITKKINDGYFTKLGVDVIWMTPLVENISGYVDEGTGVSYGFHGYWTKDWTTIDKRVGTKEEVREMVKAAHAKGIKILMDVVVNHTGPVTAKDQQWPDDWVRTKPHCVYKDYKTTIECTLVKNLPDIKTESTIEVEVPQHIQEKWKAEGRFESEMASLDAFFKRTGYPRLPYYYIIKWIVDLIEEYGIDGFRVDTVKHVEESVWKILKQEATLAYERAKKRYLAELKEEDSFYMLGEVYGFYANNGRKYDFGDQKVDYFNYGFDGLINFGFTGDAKMEYGDIFSKYNRLIIDSLKGADVVHYISSHDDGNPFDKNRERILESGTKLLLTPGIAQIYYGDEVARTLTADASGDAKLRSSFDWKSLEENDKMICLDHWQKLGQFRKNNPAVGAGVHSELSKNVFARVFKKGKYTNKVVFALDQRRGIKEIPVGDIFKDGTVLYDYYSKGDTKVMNGKVTVDNPFPMVLLGVRK